MNDDVGAMLDGPGQDRGCHRIVYDQRQTVRVGHIGKALDIANISRGVAYALAKDAARVPIDQRLNRGGIVALRQTGP